MIESMYAADNAQTIPSFYSDGGGSGEITWNKWLIDGEYVKYQTKSILLCPSSAPLAFDDTNVELSKYYTYGMLRDSVEGVSVPVPSNHNSWEYVFYKMNSTDYNPALFPLLADTRYPAVDWQIAYFFRQTPDPTLVKRHLKNTKINIGFADGHAESVGSGAFPSLGINPISVISQ